ncbi:hypothetical protein UA45_19095 [Morganella morganii]|uniref:Uncharacterized protein n=1 Tax=Morganella morganii TaxID=582 RepID=A0A0D8L3Q1_MORMO|nr:hypothetical protein UA45_19095 [Morganella morganii]
MKDLKNANKGKTLEMIIKWIENLYGYLSSPTGAEFVMAEISVLIPSFQTARQNSSAIWQEAI